MAHHNINTLMDGDINDQLNYVKYHAGLTKLMQRKQEIKHGEWLRNGKPIIVIWIAGPSGVGKSYSFGHDPWPNAKYPNFGPYTDMDRINVGNAHLNDFLKGYSGQKMVLFDDIRADSIKFETLLTLIEKGSAKQFVKSFGAITLWMPEVIYITSPMLPT